MVMRRLPIWTACYTAISTSRNPWIKKTCRHCIMRVVSMCSKIRMITMGITQYLMLPVVAMLLAACEPQMDMQGTDPKEFYAAHPIENRVETRHQSYEMYFAPR